MIVCPACQHRNPEGAEVCEACGEPLKNAIYRACAACGALNPADNVFCHRCLHKLGEPAPEGMEQPPIPEEKTRSEAERALTEEEEILPPFLLEEEETPDAEVEKETFASGETHEEELPSAAQQTEPSEAPEETLPPFIEEMEEAPSREETKGEPSEPSPEVEAPPEEQGSETLEAQTPPPAADEGPPEEGESLPQIAQAPLEGLEDGLSLEAAASLPHRAEPLPPEGPMQEEQADAELLRRIAEEGTPLQETPRKAEERDLQRLSGLERTLLYLLVLLAALTPLFTGGQMAHWVFPRQDVGVLEDTLSNLPIQTPVLVSFDYSPSYAGELDPLALAVVRQLAARSVPMIAMSTKPEGIGLATGIYDAVTEETADYQYGEDYVILGYLPGQEAGLQILRKGLDDAFKEDYVQHRALGEIPVTDDIASVQDLEHVIVFSDESNIIRRWIEQVRRENVLRLHALVSTRVEPILVPYEQAGQLETLIGGGYGAAEYERASQIESATARTVDADAILFLVMLLIAVITNVVYISKGETHPPRS